jgi:hypothetical protein
MTFFEGGQDFSVADAVFVEAAFGDPALVDAAPVVFLESAELPTEGFSGLGAVEQLGMVFRRRGRVGDGFAGLEGVCCWAGADGGCAGAGVCGWG